MRAEEGTWRFDAIYFAQYHDKIEITGFTSVHFSCSGPCRVESYVRKLHTRKRLVFNKIHNLENVEPRVIMAHPSFIPYNLVFDTPTEYETRVRERYTIFNDEEWTPSPSQPSVAAETFQKPAAETCYFKACRHDTYKMVIVVMKSVPETRIRRYGPWTTKARASAFKVHRIEYCVPSRPRSMIPIPGVTEAYSDFDKHFIYRVGKIVNVGDFDESSAQCSRGIHFFNERDHAVRYGVKYIYTNTEELERIFNATLHHDKLE